MKKSYFCISAYIITICALFTFAACKFNAADVKEYLEKYTNSAAIEGVTFDGEYPTDSAQRTCLPSDASHYLTLSLRNPQLYDLNFSYTFNNVDVNKAIKGEIESITLTEPPYTFELASDKHSAKLIFSEEFLHSIDMTKTGGKDLSGIISLTEPASGRSFESYGLSLSANTPPEEIKNPILLLTENGGGSYILCFYLPTYSSSDKQRDTTKLYINNSSYDYDPVHRTLTGTAPANLVTGTVIQDPVTGTVIQDPVTGILTDDQNTTGVIVTDTTAGIIGSYSEPNNLYSCIPGLQPSLSSVPGYQAVYYVTGKTFEEIGTGELNYSITLVDSYGLYYVTGASNKAKQLQTPTFNVTSSSSYAAGEETGTYNVIITAPTQCTDDSSCGTGVTLTYTVTQTSTGTPVFEGGTSRTLTGSAVNSKTINLPKGTYTISATASKAFYITSNASEVTGVRITQPAIFYVAETGNDDENTGASASPYRTIQHALDVFSAGITAGDYESTGVCEVRVMTDLTVPEGFAWTANSSSFANISSASASSTIKIKGYGANRTIDFESSGTNLQRTAINVAAGTVEIDGISITKLADNGNAVKALNVSGGTVTYKNSSVHDNRGNIGASIWISGGNLELRNVTVKNVGSGSATGGAGALNISGTSTVNCYDCSFTDVYGVQTGAISIGAGGSLTMQDSSILRGKSSSAGGGITNMGTLSLKNVSIKDCVTGSAASWAKNQGSGIYHNGSQLTLENVTISGCTFNENAGSEPVGAGIYNYAHIYIKGKNQITGNYLSDGTTASNMYLRHGEYINITGDLTGSRIGVYVPFVTSGTGANAPTASTPKAFTYGYGYGTTNTSLPGAIFTAENGYGITAITSGTDAGEAAFAVSSGGMYLPTDFTFTFEVKDAAGNAATGMYPGVAKTFTVIPTVTRNGAGVYYKAADKKLYLDSEFTQEAGSGTVIWNAELYNGGTLTSSASQPALNTTGGITVTVPAQSYVDTYTLKVTAEYLGVTHDISVPLDNSYSAENAASYISTLTTSGTYNVKVTGGVGSGVDNSAGNETTITSTDAGLAKVAKAIRALPSGVRINLDPKETSATSTITTYNDGKYFKDCTALRSITLPDWMQYVITSLFEACTQLTSVTLSSKTQWIKDNAFKGCTSLATINYEGTISQWAGVNQGSGWHSGVPASIVHCIDGDSPINPLGATPLTLEAMQAGAVVTFSNKASGSVTYKVNGGTAQTIASGGSAEINLTAVGDKVEFYGNNKAYGDSVSENCSSIACTKNCYVYGNIMSLIKSSGFENETELEVAYTFRNLFKGNTNISNKEGCALLLPATTIINHCYNSMFQGCTGLTKAPALPATTLVRCCYALMFYGCTNLETASELSATTLADYCYQAMFQGCTSLRTAPALQATTLASACYSSMFKNCTNLETAPELPATSLANYCYIEMFAGCTNLETAPALPATTLAQNCYDQMFSGCTSLTTAPALPATTLADSCYISMFNGCTSLTTAPALPATTLASNCYQSMFDGCTSLTTAPVLPATTMTEYCYANMFNGCTTLTAAPELSATTLSDFCYYSMFCGCTSLTTAPALPATTLVSGCYDSMFFGCTNLSSVTCLATDISVSGCTSNWLSGVASTGTFTKAAGMTWTTGSSGIPSTWTVAVETASISAAALTETNYETFTAITLDNAEGMTNLINLAKKNGDENGKTFEGKTITLNADIELSSGQNFETEFLGTFDGNGKTISGMSGVASLFMQVGSESNFDAEIKNLTVAGEATTAGIAKKLYGTISDCVNEVNVTNNGGYIEVGGICYQMGYNDENQLTSVIKGCINKGNITSTQGYVAGICAMINKGGLIENCVNEGKLTATGNHSYIGGIAGSSAGCSIINCINKGEIDSDGNNVGGIIGKCNDYGPKADIVNCYNTGTVKGSSFIGGIVGEVGLSASSNYGANIRNCYNKGEIIATSSDFGGIIGKITKKTDSNIIGNNYYLNSIASSGIGGTSVDDTSMVTSFTSSSLSDLLTNLNNWINNSSNKPLEDKYSSYTFKNWTTGSDGYPTFE